MGAGLATIIESSRKAGLVKRAAGWLAVLGGAACLTGCGGTDATPPAFIKDSNYAVVMTNTVTDGVPQPQIPQLFRFASGPKSPGELLWPYLTADDAVTSGQAVIFNGGENDDVQWKYYPALLVYPGTGSVVDVTLAACRQIPNQKADWTNYSFSILSLSNHVLRLDANQLPSNIYPERPKRLVLEWEIADVLKAANAAQTNATSQTFKGVKYYTAE